ncbi:ribophorin I [Plasmodium gonderi]|uniref:Dolichyl-diphosphooligosaccharide--protein glycosyltransferase subunit 1 n=1 Tax=Plasmodium gonderi TaxID=77519 RepID=A0A1Y1JH91_PLAGO|nr:ribophorin I [Plasmodium gonderi]GAW80705.1 ribophorin I [Plasmodium gonderi]
MKFMKLLLINVLLIFFARGKLNLKQYTNLVELDIQFLNTYKNELKEKYVGNDNCITYVHITKYFHLKKNHVEIIIRGDLKNKSDKTVDNFIFFLPYHEAFQATTLHVKDKNENHLRYQILKEVQDNGKGIKVDPFNEDYDLEQFQVKVYKVMLNKKLHKNEKISVEYAYSIGQAYYPFPVDISLMENQNLLFYFSSKILLPYNVEEKEEIKIFLCRNCTIVQMEDHNFLKNFEKMNDDTYFYEKKKKNELNAFSLGYKVLFYFQSNNNLGYFEKVVKDIKISQLGYIYEKEEYILHNNAARVNKFDRYILSDLENKHTSGEKEPKNEQTTIIYSMKSKINYDIYEYEYFDDIGKIYLIRAEEIYDKKKEKSLIQFDIRPRYPLLGGWRAHFFNAFYHHSNLYQVKNKKNYYAYKIDISPSIKSFFIKQLNVRIFLPPFSEDVSIISRDDNINILTSSKKEWLDWFTFRNVIEIQIEKFFPQIDENYYQNMLVMYKFRFFNIFRKPILIIFILFLVILLFFFLRGLTFEFNTENENLARKEHAEHKVFLEKCKELYENLSYISDKLIQSLSNLTPQEKMHLKKELLEGEEKWTYDFIYFTNEFYRNFENTTKKQTMQNYLDRCFNYHVIVKKYFEAQLLNDLNINLKEIAQAEKELMLLLKYI